jgi:hypothetical protein
MPQEYRTLAELQALFRFSSQPTIRQSLVKFFRTLRAARAIHSTMADLGLSFRPFFHAIEYRTRLGMQIENDRNIFAAQEPL